MPRTCRLVVMVAILVGFMGTAPGLTAAVPGRARTPHSPIPDLPDLRVQVDFWKAVFATYSSREVVIHDTERLDRVYSVLDFRPLAENMSDAEFQAYKRQRVEEERERIRALLVRLHQVGDDASGLSPDERRIAALFADEPGYTKFLDAAAEDRVRSQTGLRERFAGGVEISRRYLPEMESIFRSEGLPVELTRLPLVESCFNVNAYSKVGAAGIWQFMPATARHYMRVDDAVDERRDPIAATRAAATHLRRDYESLGTWPLAITAYNHGRGGMQRAVATVGSTDLQKIVRYYRGPAFKFASRNFYAEFLAALEVEENFEEYFGVLNLHPPLRASYVVVPDYTALATLARTVGTSTDRLAELNPALSGAVLSGRMRVPRGYVLRVPPGTADGFERRYAALTVDRQRSEPSARSATAADKGKTKKAKQSTAKATGSTVTHRVKAGQTLSTIARQYGTSVEAIKRRNGIRDGTRLRSGQSLVIPAS
jgi:membrane-bound lytic murein transglycosylase D